jgi:hypothetical protein
VTQTVPVHRLTFRITREETLDTKITVWGADPVDAPIPTGVTGRTLAELFEEIEAVKHFILDMPKETPVEADLVYELPGVSAEALDAYYQERAHLDESVRALAARLRAAGVSEEDSVRLLDLPEPHAGRLQRSA